VRAGLLLALLLPGPLAAQGLGDAAARERQRRQQQAKPEPARVFTDTDLEEARPPEPSESGDEAGSVLADPPGSDALGASGDDAPPGTDPGDPLERERQERRLLEAEWRVRFANAREQLAFAEAASWREVVRTELYQGIPVPMKVREQVETEELKRARQALAGLEEQLRRAGLPPGWAREN
jgi:hypothetical protein